MYKHQCITYINEATNTIVFAILLINNI